MGLDPFLGILVIFQLYYMYCREIVFVVFKIVGLGQLKRMLECCPYCAGVIIMLHQLSFLVYCRRLDTLHMCMGTKQLTVRNREGFACVLFAVLYIQGSYS